MENLTESLKRLKIRYKLPKTDEQNPAKNWNDLPESLKTKCILEMNFATRTGLRGASKSDRRLVDAHRYPISRLYIQLLREPPIFEIHVTSSKFGDEIHVAYRKTSWWKSILTKLCWRKNSQFSNFLQLFKQLLSRSKIDICHVDSKLPYSSKAQRLFYEAIVAGPKLHIANLKFALDSSARLKFAILNKCHVESLNVEVEEEGANLSGISDFARFSQVRIFERIDQYLKNGSSQLKAGYFRLAVIVRWVQLDSHINLSIDYGRGDFDVAKHFTRIRDLSHYESENALRIVTRPQNSNRHIWIWISPETRRLYCFLMPITCSVSDFQRLLKIDAAEFEKFEEFESDHHFDWVWMNEHNYCCLC